MALVVYVAGPLHSVCYLRMPPGLPLFQKPPPLSFGVLDPLGELDLVPGQGNWQILKVQGQVWGPPPLVGRRLAPLDQKQCCMQNWTRQGAPWTQGCSP